MNQREKKIRRETGIGRKKDIKRDMSGREREDTGKRERHGRDRVTGV